MSETEIIKMCKTRHFLKAIEAVSARKRMASTSSIHQLDPFILTLKKRVQVEDLARSYRGVSDNQ